MRSDRDPGRTGTTSLRLDGDTGRIAGYSVPAGRAAGDTMTTWIGDIHVADVFGWPMNVTLSLTVVTVAMLSVTGVLLWMRKRRARSSRRHPSSTSGTRSRQARSSRR